MVSAKKKLLKTYVNGKNILIFDPNLFEKTTNHFYRIAESIAFAGASVSYCFCWDPQVMNALPNPETGGVVKLIPWTSKLDNKVVANAFKGLNPDVILINLESKEDSRLLLNSILFFSSTPKILFHSNNTGKDRLLIDHSLWLSGLFDNSIVIDEYNENIDSCLITDAFEKIKNGGGDRSQLFKEVTLHAFRIARQRLIKQPSKGRCLQKTFTEPRKFKVAYISPNPFGLPGTMGTYGVITEASEDYDVLVLSKGCHISSKERSENISVINVFNSSDIKTRISDELERFQPDLLHVYGLGGIKLLNSKSKAVCPIIVDIRSPFVISSKKDLLFSRELLFQAQNYVDHFIFHCKGTFEQDVGALVRPYSYAYLSLAEESLLVERTRDFDCVQKFVFIGSIARVRKLATLIDCFGKVAEDHYSEFGEKIILDIYGDGNDLDKMRSYVKEKGFGEYISLLGFVAQEKLRDKLVEYDVGIAYVPVDDIFGKAPSLKLAEYCAAGLQVIASASDGHKDFVRDIDLTCYYFDNTPESFCLAVLAVQKQSSKRLNIYKNRSNVERLTTRNIFQDEYVPLYKRLMKNKNIGTC